MWIFVTFCQLCLGMYCRGVSITKAVVEPERCLAAFLLLRHCPGMSFRETNVEHGICVLSLHSSGYSYCDLLGYDTVVTFIDTSVSEEHVACIFSTDHEEGGSMFL